MNIETKWNINDRVWAVLECWHDRDIACGDCQGKGGAHVPNTRVWVKCQSCDGEGKLEKTVVEYEVCEMTIKSMTIRVGEYREGVEITFSCSYGPGVVSRKDTSEVFSTKEEAEARLVTLQKSEA